MELSLSAARDSCKQIIIFLATDDGFDARRCRNGRQGLRHDACARDNDGWHSDTRQEASTREVGEDGMADKVEAAKTARSPAKKLLTEFLAKVPQNEKGQLCGWPKSLILLVGTE